MSPPPADDRKLLDAIHEVGNQVNLGSMEVQDTVRATSATQTSAIRGIWRLIDERTTERKQLNDRRRAVWQQLNQSLGTIHGELAHISGEVERSNRALPALGQLEAYMAEFRSESRSTLERIEGALADLRDDQWIRVESMVTELREAERERVDQVLDAVREEGDRRLADVKQAGDLRVFDAIRTGDTRVEAQREVMRSKVAGLEAIYRERATHLESVYKEQNEALRKDKHAEVERHRQNRRKILARMLVAFDNLDARVKNARMDLSVWERERLPGLDEHAGAEQDSRLSAVGRWLSKRELERAESERANLLARLAETEERLRAVLLNRLQVLEDLRDSMLSALKAEGIEPFASIGERFHPDLHVAIDEVPARSGQTPGTVISVRRCGYLLEGEVLRHSEVVVAT